MCERAIAARLSIDARSGDAPSTHLIKKPETAGIVRCGTRYPRTEPVEPQRSCHCASVTMTGSAVVDERTRRCGIGALASAPRNANAIVASTSSG
jgi:hypothetical protein